MPKNAPKLLLHGDCLLPTHSSLVEDKGINGFFCDIVTTVSLEKPFDIPLSDFCLSQAEVMDMFRVTARKNRRQNLATTVVVWAISYVMTPRPDSNVLLMYPSSVSPGIARRPLARTPAPTMETRPQPNATAVEKRGTLLVSVLTVEVVRAMVEGETAVMVEDSLRKLGVFYS